MRKIVDQRDIIQLIKADKIFADIYTRYGTPPNWSRQPGFISLSKIILEQQVSLESANAHFKKLNNYLPEFTSTEIAKLSDEEMRRCQISRQKSTYLRALSYSILDGKIDLKSLPKLTPEDIRQRLKMIKGIGNWTIDIYMMFCLQMKDVFPIGDIAVVKTIKEFTELVTKEEILEYSEKWKPYRSLATFFLWNYYLQKRNRHSVL